MGRATTKPREASERNECDSVCHTSPWNPREPVGPVTNGQLEPALPWGPRWDPSHVALRVGMTPAGTMWRSGSITYRMCVSGDVWPLSCIEVCRLTPLRASAVS